jgi:hypothetical protein
MELHTIGIDLGKTVFHLVGVNMRGEVVVRKKFSRKAADHTFRIARDPETIRGDYSVHCRQVRALGGDCYGVHACCE